MSTPNQSLFLVTLLVSDQSLAKSFYCTQLGFDCIEDSAPEGAPGAKRRLVIRPPSATGGGAALNIALATTEAQKAAVGNQAGGRVGFFLRTDDFARDHKAMVEKGVEFLEEPRYEAYGTVAVFKDPSGNTWDLIQDGKA
ncbi:Glyoxalase/Bleomycin resistance protein/Dihydroxybiphenyl dioxygenase [Podospora aff. communis PSN243]|uniref:Glyoxalase/Bleomycin resistance protein/Dihydroxybiphenyl dioxygenase n=1 Tax=Podospora aff. communis PSN243 TaxID=3040156 RepID=A0AAV9GYR7_9PEZI|nr:Glyoxalase/Bleomycin resistance protein/Dihydroxybiphenyl dioxygenase [Podospora aff. communis PSN243]